MIKKEQKPNYFRWWLIALLIFVVFGVFVGSENRSEEPIHSDDDLVEVEAEEKEETEKEETENEESETDED